MKNLKFRIALMLFFQYAAWGAWLISIGAFIFNYSPEFTANGGLIFGIMGIATLFMPTLMGIIADRWIPAQYVAGICQMLSGISFATAGWYLSASGADAEFWIFYFLMFLAIMFYMPTISITTAVSFALLEKSGLNPDKYYPPIRAWGTVGFIISMWIVNLTHFNANHMQLYYAAAISIILSIITATMPNCPPAGTKRSESWIDTWGLRAFKLFKNKRMATFFIFAILIGLCQQINNSWADSQIRYWVNVPADMLSEIEIWISRNIYGEYSTIFVSISQIAEACAILAIPFVMRKYNIKAVMIIALLAWIIRFALLGFGGPSYAGIIMFFISMLIYGVAFDFFNISSQLYVEQNAESSIRSSAQGLFMMMATGVGAILGSSAGQLIFNRFITQNSEGNNLPFSGFWFVWAAYAIIVLLLFLYFFRDLKKGNPRNIY